MADHVVVIASGETERRSLPHLVSHLQKQGTSVDDVRIPPRNKALDVDDQVYTARVSEQIARVLDAENIARRSPSFRGFLDALLNGVTRA